MDAGIDYRHWLSLGLALLAGGWFAVREPDQRLFEQAMRSAGLTGPVLGPLDAVTSIAVAFAAMVAVYALVYSGIGLARRGRS